MASILAARVVWTGILTVRAAVWSANYPRQAIARYTGRIVIVSSLAVAAAAALAAWVLDKSGSERARWLYIAGAAAGLLGAWLYRAARVRREFALLAEETAAVGRTEPFSLGMLFEILRKDPHFREYMFWMGVFGGGTDHMIQVGARQTYFVLHEVAIGSQVWRTDGTSAGTLPVSRAFRVAQHEGHRRSAASPGK